MATEDEGPPYAPPPVTEADALKFVGKYVIVGITNEDAFGEVTDQYQMDGVIESVSPLGIQISLRGSRQGDTYTLPPAMDSLQPAPPGEYRLRKTGEVVTDPDYTTSWTVTAPQKR